MTPINIIIVISVIVVVCLIITYLVWKRVTGRGEDCSEAPMTGKDLVRMYHKMYGKKKGKCAYFKKEKTNG